MAIDPNKVKWAENLEIDPVSGLPNKAEPPEELKLSGVKREQNWTRQHVNYLLDQYHEMFTDLQQQINDLTVSAGVGTLQIVFPIGSYYTNATSDADPSVALGFGTWIRVEGRFIVGVDELDTTWDAGLKTGGSKNHTHTATNSTAGGHSHGGSAGATSLTIAQIPSHTHTYSDEYRPNTVLISVGEVGQDYFLPDAVNSINKTTTATGSGQSHTHSISTDGGHTHTITVTNASNVPPFEAAFIWRRTA